MKWLGVSVEVSLQLAIATVAHFGLFKIEIAGHKSAEAIAGIGTAHLLVGRGILSQAYLGGEVCRY